MRDIRPEDLEKTEDGRNIDPRLGILSGEASGQRVKSLESAFPGREPLRTRPTQSGVSAESPSYYGQPAIKEPVWIWSIPLYFYVGGVSGAASALGAAADVFGGKGMEGLGRKCRWVGMVGETLSAGLLIHDLGRPSRFLNMLRVFRPTSPMSVGSWVLAAAGAMDTAALVLSGRRGWLGHLGRGSAIASGVLGLPLSGYTAVLISNSAVPVWQATRKTLPLLFMSSAVASAGSLLELLPSAEGEKKAIRLFGAMGKVAELVAGAAVQHEASRLEVVGRPLEHGPTGRLWKASKVATVASLVLGAWPGRQHWPRLLGAAIGTAGAIALRFAVFRAGKASASDPQATFQPQRQGLGASEVMRNTHASDGRPLQEPLPVERLTPGPRALAPAEATQGPPSPAGR